MPARRFCHAWSRRRRTTYHDETVSEAYESRRRRPAPQWQYDAWVSTCTAIRDGELAAVSSAVEEITGTPRESLRYSLASR